MGDSKMAEEVKTNYSMQDYSLIKEHVRKIQEDQEFNQPSNAFYYFALNYILNLQEDEISDCITDTFFLTSTGSETGHDRGIDAVYIDESESTATIHFFNFKYAETFEITKGFFPATEIDKISSFLDALMSKNEYLKSEINAALYAKSKEIWSIMDGQNPNFEIHICSNRYNGFEKEEKVRFERMINKWSGFKINYDLMPNLVRLVTSRGKRTVNARIKAINKNYFEKSDGDIRAMVLNVDARDLLRIVIDDDDLRKEPDLNDYSVLKNTKVIEDAFESNVRIYLKQRSKINRNIKNTAQSDDSYKFFYYNNGITITCDNFSYPSGVRSPIVELFNLQVVNGGQTLHALYEAFKEDENQVENIEILCRIYQTQNVELSTHIAEYTNSQNPVSSRDIRAIDLTQQILEQEFLVKNLYYERKKNQHRIQSKRSRIDAEKAGQVLMAYFNKMPAEAKNKKRLIFGDKYDEVFDDNVNTDRILLAYNLFQSVEEEKNNLKSKWFCEPEKYESESYILYASYYILYIFGELADQLNIEHTLDNKNTIYLMYSLAKEIVSQLIEKERKEVKEKYEDASFFKSNKPKKHFESILDSDKRSEILEKAKQLTKHKN